MSTPLSAAEILDREFLGMRARILELAALFDRVERAAGDVNADVRVQRIREALALLDGNASDRAEQVQLVFSRPYEDDWREKFKLAPAR